MKPAALETRNTQGLVDQLTALGFTRRQRGWFPGDDCRAYGGAGVGKGDLGVDGTPPCPGERFDLDISALKRDDTVSGLRPPADQTEEKGSASF